MTSYFFLCVSEVKLSLASFLSDRIVDEILEALSSSQLTLVGHKWFSFFLSLQLHFLLSLLFPCFCPNVVFPFLLFSPFSQADHLVRRGRPLVQQDSVDLDVPEEKIPKRASTEMLEAERLEDLEACVVGEDVPVVTVSIFTVQVLHL